MFSKLFFTPFAVIAKGRVIGKLFIGCRVAGLLVFFGLLFLTVSAVQAAPPVNDSLAAPTVLSGLTGSTSGTVAEATRETGEFSHGFVSSDMVFRTVWYEWTAADTKPVVFEVNSAGFDASMGVYTGSSFPVTTISRNNNTVGNLPRIEFMAQIGTTYKIMIGSFNTDVVPNALFSLQWSQNNTPTNDNFAQAIELQGTSGFVAATTQNATVEAQEPVFGSGTNTVWFKFTNTTPFGLGMTATTTRSFDTALDTTMAVYTGNAVNSLSTLVKNNNAPTTPRSRVTFFVGAGNTVYIAINRQSFSSDGNIILDWKITKQRNYTDFATKFSNDGEIYYDQAADITVFRPSNGVWYSLDSSSNVFRAFQFGLNGDTPVPADYDGDGRSDYAVTRDESGLKVWYVRRSFDETYTVQQWGIAGDREMPGDYDYDGRTDQAVYRPSNNTWYILRSSDNQAVIKNFGLAGDIPVFGDFKNTSEGADIAVFRPSNGTWYIFDGVNTIVSAFGTADDRPVPSDYDNDDKTDLAVWRPSTGVWHYLQSANNQYRTAQWGLAGDIPMIGDYDNNTNDKDDFAVWRPSDQTWYVLRSEGTVVTIIKFGLAGDIPASSPAILMQ